METFTFWKDIILAKKIKLSNKWKNLKKRTKILIQVLIIGTITLSIILPIVILNSKVVKQDKKISEIDITEEEEEETEIYKEVTKSPKDTELKTYWKYENKEYDTYDKAYEALAHDYPGEIYTQAQIDARDTLGPFPTKRNALLGLAKVGENLSDIFATGDGSGNTYTQAQIDHAKGGTFVAPYNAVVGWNSPASFDMQLDSSLSNENYEIIKKIISILKPLNLIDQDFLYPLNNPSNKIPLNKFIANDYIWIKNKGFTNLDALRFEALINDLAWVDKDFTNYDKVDKKNHKINWYFLEIPAIGDGSGNHYNQKQIDARDASGPFPVSVEDANIAIIGKNISQVISTGDASGNTYTQAQIDHAKGGEFVAPDGAIKGLNEKNLKKLAETLITKIKK